MLRRVITALARSTDSTGILVVGGVLTISTWISLPLWVAATLAAPPVAVVGPLVLTPALIVRGYFVRILANGIETGNADGAASFIAWNELYRDGIRSMLLSAVLLAPLVFLLAMATLVGVALRSALVDLELIAAAIESVLGPSGTTAVVAAAVGLLTVITVAYLFVYAYVKPAALAAFAVSGQLRDGLRPSRIVRVAGSSQYAAAWVVATATLVAGYAIAGPLVLVMIGGVIVFGSRVIAHGVYGRGARAALSGTASTTIDSATVDTVDEASVRVAPPESTARGVPSAVGSHSRPAQSMGDGGSQSPWNEAPPAVQSGRTVEIDCRPPFGASSNPQNADESNPADLAGFEWVSEGRMAGDKDKS